MNESEIEVRDGLWYSEEHEWARIEDNVAVVGITDYAQKELNNVVLVELPKVGDKLTFQKDLGYVKSTKTVNTVHSPVSGEVIEVNSKLKKSPELVNSRVNSVTDALYSHTQNEIRLKLGEFEKGFEASQVGSS